MWRSCSHPVILQCEPGSSLMPLLRSPAAAVPRVGMAERLLEVLDPCLASAVAVSALYGAWESALELLFR